VWNSFLHKTQMALMLPDDLKLFIVVAQERSLSAAARTIRSTPSTVSRRISALEMEFGASLINRTTRQLSLTSAGQIVLERSRQIVRDIDALRDELSQAQEKPTGTLKISASVGFGGRYVAPLLGEFRRRYPQVRIDLRLEDERIDLVAGEADVAIRVGTLPDSQLRHVSLASLHRVACASPAYVRFRGRPSIPGDLLQHDCIVVRAAGRAGGAWQFRDTKALQFRPVVTVSSHEAASAAALSGAGVAHLPWWLVAKQMQSGSLERLLPDFEQPDVGGVHVLWVGQAPARVRVFVAFLRERIRSDDLMRPQG
jgi:LysR family transcriptional activator of dmlA